MSHLSDYNPVTLRIYGTAVDVYHGMDLVTDQDVYNKTTEFDKVVITLDDEANGVLGIDLTSKTIRKLLFIDTLVDLVKCQAMLPQTPLYAEIEFENATIINDDNDIVTEKQLDTASKLPVICASIVTLDSSCVVENPEMFKAMFSHVGCFQVSEHMPFLTAVCLFPDNATMIGSIQTPVEVDYLHEFLLENPWCRGAHVRVRNAVEMREIETLCICGTLDPKFVVPVFSYHDSTKTYGAYWDTYPEFLAVMNAMASLPEEVDTQTRMRTAMKAKRAYQTENYRSRHFFNPVRQTMESALELAFKQYTASNNQNKNTVTEITTGMNKLQV